MKRRLITCLIGLILTVATAAPALTLSRDQLVALTSSWTGERYPDGRPKVPDDLIQRMRGVSLEEAWSVLRRHGFRNQFEGNWKMIHSDVPVVGRALTAVYMPARPDYVDHITSIGKDQGRVGASNSWPIDMLQPGDVYVADGFGKIENGTLIGDNLGNAIFAKSGNGVVFHGSVRDLAGLEEIEGFNAFVRGWDPSAIQDMILGGVNVPIRIGGVSVLPGDIVLAKREGVLFIPPHLVEEVVVTSEVVSLKDRFGHLRLRQGRYTPGEIDRRWSPEIKADFLEWYDAQEDVPKIPRSELEKHL